jgi:hypothetical protein
VSLPVPLDVADLVVRELRRLLADRRDEIAAGVRVSTETGRGHDGGPPRLPWLLEEAVCTAGEMKAAVCGTLLMRGQEQGWLEPHLYDMLASGAQGHPDWQLAMSLIKRQDPASFHTPRPAEN